MKKNGDIVRVRELYELLEKMREEILGEVKSLRTDFLEMEKGRLTRLEQNFAEFKGENKVRVGMTAAIVSVIITIGLFILSRFW